MSERRFFVIILAFTVGFSTYSAYRQGAMQAELDAANRVWRAGAEKLGSCVANQKQCYARLKRHEPELFEAPTATNEGR